MSPAPPPTSPFFLDTLFDLITVLLINAILLLSLLSLAFIFHLRFNSRSSPHLHNFSALWSLRLLLVISVILWSVSFLLRSSLFLQRLRLFTLSQGTFLCRLHVVLTLGLFQPAFLTTLLLLLNLSIQKSDPARNLTNIAHILCLCLPVLLFQIFVVFYAPTTTDILPEISSDETMSSIKNSPPEMSPPFAPTRSSAPSSSPSSPSLSFSASSCLAGGSFPSFFRRFSVQKDCQIYRH